MKHYSNNSAVEDEAQNRRSSVCLWDSDVTHPSRARVEEAIHEVAAAVRGGVADRYKQFVTPERLVAVQPNCHNGQDHLPFHIDDPDFEGFGMVIATVAIEGDATIVLQGRQSLGADRRRSWAFELEPGMGYAISGFARNQAVHGVLGAASPDRKSLNMRFGLHDVGGQGEFSCAAELRR